MNILGIDFEEWFHPELVKPFIKNQNKEMKVSKGIKKILDWLNKNETYACYHSFYDWNQCACYHIFSLANIFQGNT